MNKTPLVSFATSTIGDGWDQRPTTGRLGLRLRDGNSLTIGTACATFGPPFQYCATGFGGAGAPRG